MPNFQSVATWLKGAYSEPGGQGSSTRLHITALIAFVLSVGAGFAVLVHKHSITIEQFDGFLTSASVFLTSTCGSLYGLNKAADWAKNHNDNNPQV
jgi:hypothetical protein